VIYFAFFLSISRSFGFFGDGGGKALYEFLVLGLLFAIVILKRSLSRGVLSQKYFSVILTALFVGVISTIMKGSPFFLAVIQLLLANKFWLTLLIVMLYSRNMSARSSYEFIGLFDKLILVLIVLSLCAVVMQLISPGIYRIILPGVPEGASQAKYFLGMSLVPSTGIFFHPGLSAIFYSLSIFYLYSISLLSPRSRLFLISTAMILLFATLQRAEILVFLLAFVGFGTTGTLGLKSSVKPLLFAFLVLALSWELFSGALSGRVSYVAESAESVPRFAMLSGAITIAKDYFPLGSGYATYGGAQAIYNSLNVFAEAGVDRLWWYQQGKFLTDSYWPMVIGELGLVGFVLYISAFWFLVASFSIGARRSADSLFRAGACGKMVVFCIALNAVFSPTLSGDLFPILMASVILVQSETRIRLSKCI
jgi:hypothetical protein